jgi:DNA polymerase-1
MVQRQTLVLTDGTAMLYRGFYAIPRLSTKAGQATNAVFGFVRMTEQLMRNWKPTHAVVAFDGGMPPERRALLPEYKANRKPMPDALRSQIPMVVQYLKAAGIRTVRLDDQEADDVMATLAVRAREDFAQVLMATCDKDLFQVVDDVIRIVPQSGDAATMGPDDVLRKTGVRPEQVADWLALAGDASDNIPGVPGVGAKTAAKLLSEFGTVESLLAGIPGIPNARLRTAIEGAREQVERNRRLATLRRDVPCGLSWEEVEVGAPDREALRALFEAWEFHSLANAMAQPMLGL